MEHFLKNIVLKPGLERLGTVYATWALATTDMWCAVHNVCGVTPDIIDASTLVLQVAVGLAFDWGVIAWKRARSK